MSDEEDFVESDSEDEGSKKKKKSPKKTTKKTEKAEKKTPSKKKSSSNKENEKPSSASKKKDKDGGTKTLSDKEAGPRLIEYMREQNRPFNAVGLFENLKQAIKKATLQKLLDKYAEQGIFTCKITGKQKLYFITQDPKAICSEQELTEKDEQIKKLDSDLKDRTAAATKATQEWNALKNEPTTDELTKLVAAKEKNITEMNTKLTQLTSGNVKTITSDEMAKVNKQFDYYLTQWKKRKKACMDSVYEMYESAEDGVSREDRLSSLGMDTDEDNNVDIKTYEALVLPAKRGGAMAVGCKRLKTS